jgi:hypothetical protein
MTASTIGDIQIFPGTGAYNFQSFSFKRKRKKGEYWGIRDQCLVDGPNSLLTAKDEHTFHVRRTLSKNLHRQEKTCEDMEYLAAYMEFCVIVTYRLLGGVPHRRFVDRGLDCGCRPTVLVTVSSMWSHALMSHVRRAGQRARRRTDTRAQSLP